MTQPPLINQTTGLLEWRVNSVVSKLRACQYVTSSVFIETLGDARLILASSDVSAEARMRIEDAMRDADTMSRAI